MTIPGGLWITSSDQFGRQCWVNNVTGQTTCQWVCGCPIISAATPPMQIYGSSPPQYGSSPCQFGSSSFLYGSSPKQLGVTPSSYRRYPMLSMGSDIWERHRDAMGKKFWINLTTLRVTYRDPYV